MKAEIINVPVVADSVVVLFAIGLKFKGQEIYLESTGNNSLDTRHKKVIHYAFKEELINGMML